MAPTKNSTTRMKSRELSPCIACGLGAAEPPQRLRLVIWPWWILCLIYLLPGPALRAGDAMKAIRLNQSNFRMEAVSAQLLKQPSRLELRPLSTNIGVGDTTEWEVVLRSANGAQVAAPSSFPVVVAAGSAPGTKVEFPAGATSVRVRLPLTNAGVATVQAHSAGLTSAKAATYVHGVGAIFNPPGRQSLQLVVNSERALANGRDFIRVQAIVIGNPLPNPVTLRLAALNGHLEPEMLQIPRGASSAEAKLTANRAGKVTVECISVSPQVDIKSPRLSVDFLPDVHPALMISPTNIWLLERAFLTVTLLDSTGRVLKATEKHRVELGIKSGHPGELATNSLLILPEESVASTSFSPYWSGPVEFTASVAESVPLGATLRVRTPWPVICMSLVCGAVGGLLAAWRQKVPKKDFRWRVMAGAATGFVLYIACAFGLLLGGLRGFSVHMLGAIVVSILGGFLGTEVFALLIKRLGLTTEPTPSKARHQRVRD